VAKASPVEAGLRRALLGGAVVIAVGTAAELVLAEHWEAPIQRLPFAVTAALTAAGVWFALRPGRAALWGLRLAAMVAVGAGGFGVFEHGEHNWEFEAEIRPTATQGELAVEALFGANPLLAPGMISVAGLLALAAAWRHPGFGK
jgi:hypothetical protein